MTTGEKTFPKLDSATAEFWDARYRENFTPWDFGGVPRQFAEFVAKQPHAMRTLIPGCGSGYEVRFLAERRWEVLAIDYSPEAVKCARKNLGGFEDCIKQADFFEFRDAGRPFDLVYERTFLCALKPTLWPSYGARMASIVRPGGLLAGYFYRENKSGGPPFAMGEDTLATLLSDNFVHLEKTPAADSIPIFAGRESWEVWQRK